jgi:PAS domain S-box-containing protein
MQPLVAFVPVAQVLLAAGILLSVGVYALSRTRYYYAAAWLTILLWYLFMVVIDREGSAPDNAHYFFAIIIFLIHMLLPLRQMLIMLLLTLVLETVLVLLHPSSSLLVALIFNGIVAIFVSSTGFLRHRDVQRLRQSEARYRSLMEAATETLVVFGEHGVIIDVNPAFEQLTGCTLSEMRGKNVLDLIAAEDRERVRQHWRSGQTGPLQAGVRRKDGGLRRVEMWMRREQYQGQPARLVAARDITDQVLIERGRRDLERRYQALFNNTADAVYTIGPDGSILSANARALEMMRAQRHEVEGSNYTSFMAPEEAQRARQTIDRLLEGERQPLYERRFRRKDGSQFVAEVNAMPVLDEEGQVLYIQSIVRDTTDRRRMEEREFELALQRERMKILQNFIDDASHYFRTPLTNLKTGTYLLTRFAHVPDKQREQLAMMTLQMTRLEQLLDDLLMVARLEKEAGDDTRKTRVDVNKLILQLLSIYFGDNAPHRQLLDFQPDQHLLEVFGDRNRLSDAISNVLLNARNYTPAEGSITIRTCMQHGMVVIEVQDSGIGIEDEDLPRIFDNFYRAESARAMDTTGSGMGLPITRKIIQMHRGVMRVFSTPGQGSTFQIILPPAGDWTTVTQELAAVVPPPAAG